MKKPIKWWRNGSYRLVRWCRRWLYRLKYKVFDINFILTSPIRQWLGVSHISVEARLRAEIRESIHGNYESLLAIIRNTENTIA